MAGASEALDPHRVTSSPAMAAAGRQAPRSTARAPGALDVVQALQKLGLVSVSGGNLESSAALARPWSSCAVLAVAVVATGLASDLDPAGARPGSPSTSTRRARWAARRSRWRRRWSLCSRQTAASTSTRPGAVDQGSGGAFDAPRAGCCMRDRAGRADADRVVDQDAAIRAAQPGRPAGPDRASRSAVRGPSRHARR
jgi:hypothetical protein